LKLRKQVTKKKVGASFRGRPYQNLTKQRGGTEGRPYIVKAKLLNRRVRAAAALDGS
jgi:hypothetical protein